MPNPGCPSSAVVSDVAVFLFGEVSAEVADLVVDREVVVLRVDVVVSGVVVFVTSWSVRVDVVARSVIVVVFPMSSVGIVRAFSLPANR